MKLAIFVSGGGSNARTIIDRFQAHPEDGVEVVLVVTGVVGTVYTWDFTHPKTETIRIQRRDNSGSTVVVLQVQVPVVPKGLEKMKTGTKTEKS